MFRDQPIPGPIPGPISGHSPRSALAALFVLACAGALAGCPGGSGTTGDPCGGHDDCDGTLQCLNNRCVAQCERAPECGDGYACDDRGYCLLASGTDGDDCASEVDCRAGLSCQISDVLEDNNLGTSCTAQSAGRPAGAPCEDVADCRSGTCALGRCVDLCKRSRDCAAGHSCVTIPHVPLTSATFSGCLPSAGAVSWSIPMSSPSGEVLLPVPVVARSAQLVMTVNDPGQKVGATEVLIQSDKDAPRPYTVPCSMSPFEPCSSIAALDHFYAQPIRHLPAFGQSVLLFPSGTSEPIGPHVYRVDVSSFRANNAPGSAIPRVTAVVQLSAGAILDLHFFFLDLTDHPCGAMTNHATLNARSAESATFFKDTYLGELRSIFAGAGVALGTVTLEDIRDRPKLDTLDVAQAGDLLRLGKYATGINVFFVRSLVPIGLAAFGPNPGPAGIAGTPQSGIAIGLDTLCYRDWTKLARITAHEIGRYMGLYHNVEPELAKHGTWRDLIDDNDAGPPGTNLMFFSELGGVELSRGQQEVLKRSAVLR
jgi:hypothetical protein